MNDRYFSASWSRTLRVLTLLFGGLLFFTPILLWWQERPDSAGALIPLFVIPWAILLGSMAFTVRGYSVTGGEIVIHHLLFARRYPLARLEQATIDPSATQLSIRTFGIGGLGGYIGWFRNEQLGNYLAFVTDSANLVVLRFTGRTVVISPARPADFLDAIQPEQLSAV
jgi:hypothetical protein